MRKIPNSYENPLDNLLISIADTIQPIFHKLNFTPNMLTTISLLLCLISVYYFFNGYYYHSAILFLMSYFFDCADGHYARSYNLVTEFGDYYDHFSDIFKYLLLFYTMYKVDTEKFSSLIPYISFIFVFMLIHLSCQELYYTDVSAKTMRYLNYLCPANKNNVNDFLNLTKFGGCGTFNLFVFFAIIWYGK